MISDPAVAAQLARDSTTLVENCIIDCAGGAWMVCEHGWQTLWVAPGGSVLGGTVILKPGGMIRALPEGGFILGEPCPQCSPAAAG